MPRAVVLALAGLLLPAVALAAPPVAQRGAPPHAAPPPAHAPAAAKKKPPAPPASELASIFGPRRYLIERIVIKGNRRTRASLIRGVLTVAPGQILDEREVLRSRLKVLALGLFRRVDMRLKRGTARGRVVLVVDVEERPSLMISDLFLGTTDLSPVYGGFGISDGNLFGSGLLGSSAFVVGSDGRFAVRASLHDPGLAGSDLIAGLTGTFVRGVEVSCPTGLGQCDSKGLDRLRYRRAGGILSVGIAAGRDARVYVHYRGESLQSGIETSDLRLTDPTLPAPVLPSIAPGSSFLSTFAVAFETDTRDDPFIATRGTRVLLSVEVSSKLFFSDYDYSRYRVSLSHYVKAFKNHSIRLHLFGGLVQGNAPFFDRFQVADHSFFTVGANTVPRALELSFAEISRYDDVIVSGDVTYQIPVFSGGSFFYRGYLYAAAAVTLSAHTVDRSLLDLSFNPKNEVSRFPVSGDIGLRVDTAIGVFSLGIAYPLDLLL